MVPSSAGTWLVWSERAGTYALPLDASGAPSGPRVQLGARCTGGVAAALDGGALITACGRRADPDRGRDGELLLIELRAGVARVLAEWPSLGPQSRGVALLVLDDERWVGWHDARLSVSRTWIARFAAGVADPPREISSFNVQGGPPALSALDGEPVVAWTEGGIAPSGHAAGRLLVRRGDRPARPSLDVAILDAPLRLLAQPSGLVLALRDSRPAGARERIFLGRLDDDLALDLADVRSPGRADGDDAPVSLTACGGSLFALTHRRSSRGVTMASLRRLEAETLSPLEDEHQIYEYHARMSRSAAACVGGRLLVVVGEQRTSVNPRLSAHVLRCAPGVRHERTPPRQTPAASEDPR